MFEATDVMLASTSMFSLATTTLTDQGSSLISSMAAKARKHSLRVRKLANHPSKLTGQEIRLRDVGTLIE